MADDEAERRLLHGVVDTEHPYYKDRPVSAADAQKRREIIRESNARHDAKLRGVQRRLPELPKKFGKLDLAAAQEVLEAAYVRILSDLRCYLQKSQNSSWVSWTSSY